MKQLVLFGGIFWLAFCLSLAQEPKKRAGMLKLRHVPALTRLSFLMGNFTTETFIYPNQLIDKGATGNGTAVIKWGLDSMFLVIDEESQNEFLGNYKGHGLLGYEPAETLYNLSMFNSYGDRPSYKGKFSGDTLVLEAKVPMQGGFFNQQILWFQERNKLKLRVLNDMGEGYLPALEQTYISVTKSSKEDRKK